MKNKISMFCAILTATPGAFAGLNPSNEVLENVDVEALLLKHSSVVESLIAQGLAFRLPDGQLALSPELEEALSELFQMNESETEFAMECNGWPPVKGHGI